MQWTITNQTLMNLACMTWMSSQPACMQHIRNLHKSGITHLHLQQCRGHSVIIVICVGNTVVTIMMILTSTSCASKRSVIDVLCQGTTLLCFGCRCVGDFTPDPAGGSTAVRKTQSSGNGIWEVQRQCRQSEWQRFWRISCLSFAKSRLLQMNGHSDTRGIYATHTKMLRTHCSQSGCQSDMRYQLLRRFTLSMWDASLKPYDVFDQATTCF
jgi:hypothetical protein